MNKAWRNFAYHRRLEFALSDEPTPSRAILRASLKQTAPSGLRRAIFGQWRHRRG